MNNWKVEDNLANSKKQWKKPSLISLSVIKTFLSTEGEFDDDGFDS